MSKYTTQLRFICESEAGLTESQGFNSIDEIITTAAPKIFNFDFPIFDENYRLPLEKKILKNYYTREICEETVGLWKLRLDNRLNIIMPYYNQLYQSELIKFNPLYDTDLTTDYQKTHESEQDTTGTSSEVGNITTNDNVTDTLNREINTTENSTQNRQAVETEQITLDSDITEQVTDDKGIHTTDNTIEKITNVDGKTSHNDVHQLIHDVGGKVTHSDTQVNDTKWQEFSDTPQGGISDLNDRRYMTNAQKNTDIGSTVSDITDTLTDDQDNSTVTDYTDTIQKEENRTTNNTKDETTADEINKTRNQDDTTNKSNNVNETITTNKTTKTTEKSVDNLQGVHITDTTKNGTTTGNLQINGTEDYVQHVLGKSAGKSYSLLLNEFRETFLNIDRMIINELRDLFFGLW